MQIRRSIGPIGLLLLSIGSIVGSGWLLGPFFAARIAGPGAILAWPLGGLLIMLVALSFTELATLYPVTGSSIQFLQISHGTLVSYTFAWITWISSTAVPAIETLVITQYAHHYFPWLMIEKESVYVLTMHGRWVAAALLLSMCYINAIGVKSLEKSNAILMCWKLLIPAFTVILLILMHCDTSRFSSAHLFKTGSVEWSAIFMSLPNAGIIYSFLGFTAVVQLAGEVKKPQFSIPFAIIGSLFFCLILYTGLEFAFVGAIPESAFAGGWHTLHYLNDAAPFVGLFTLLGVLWYIIILYLDAVISPYGTGLIYVGSTARTAFAMGENGYMFPWLCQLNRHGVPHRLIFFNFFFGLLFFLPFPSWQSMMSFLVSATVLSYAVGPLALLVLRKKMPDAPRPFRLPYANVLSFLAFYVCNLILLWVGWTTIEKMLILIVLGYGFLFFFRKSHTMIQLPIAGKNIYWLLAYFISIAMISYSASFTGGKNWLPFGWDFLAVFVMSVLIFIWAYQVGCKTDISANNPK